MTVGLKDVVLLSEMLSVEDVPKFDDIPQVLAQMQAFHWKRKQFSSTINILAQALYALFAAGNGKSHKRVF
jgi:squalene monooxygenase